MERSEVIKEKAQLGGYKVIKRQYYIETVNNLNQLIHFIDLSYVKANIFYHGWIGFRTNEQMKEILNGHFRDIFEEFNCKSLLTDCSKMKGSFVDLNKWYIDTFIPDLENLGLKNSATISPSDTFAQLAVKEWSDKIKGIKHMTFNSLSDTLNWLALV
jgi:hypothetical protein